MTSLAETPKISSIVLVLKKPGNDEMKLSDYWIIVGRKPGADKIRIEPSIPVRMENRTNSRRQPCTLEAHTVQMVEQFNPSWHAQRAFSKPYGVSLAMLHWCWTKTNTRGH